MNEVSGTAQVDPVHHYHWGTGVSLELPVAFEKVAEDPTSVMYAAIDADDVWPVADVTVPRIQVRVVAAVSDGADPSERHAAVAAIGRGYTELEGEVDSTRDHLVDDEPAVTVVVRQDSGAVLRLSATSTEHRLISVVATTHDDTLLPSLEAAVDSIRLIEL